jgi:hypothetical protein
MLSLWNFQWVNGGRMGIDRETERERTEREGEREGVKERGRNRELAR